jgi:tripartite-type tricarboxylate transporter receptor subunit TctC
MLAILPNVVVVTKNLPVGSLQELIAYARARPDELTYSSVGVGSSQHLAGLFFEQLTGTKMRHLPYRVTAQLVTDLITGVVPLAFQNITNVLGQVQSGDLRPLAIASKSRSVTLPDVPTAAEAGLAGYESSAWFALLAPHGTPRPIIEKVNGAAVAALNSADLRKRLIDIGAEPAPMSPEELRAFISAEIVKWREIINRGGVPAEQYAELALARCSSRTGADHEVRQRSPRVPHAGHGCRLANPSGLSGRLQAEDPGRRARRGEQARQPYAAAAARSRHFFDGAVRP